MRWRSALGIAALAAIVAAAVLAVPEGVERRRPRPHGWRRPQRGAVSSAARAPGRHRAARARRGADRVLLADRVQRAGGLADDSEERRWTSAAAAQSQFISDLGRAGVSVKPEFRYTRR